MKKSRVILGTSVMVVTILTATSAGEERVDHKLFDELLDKYVDGHGLVYYKGWRESKQDVALLDKYLAGAGAVDPVKLTERERMAFWINVYNALTLKAMLEFYPIKSIKDKVSSFFGYNVWKDYKLEISGKKYSLDEIEHKILRKMGDPLIHFGLVCASKGCPRLRNRAYTADRVRNELAENARAFFTDRTKFTVDTASKVVWLSPIFKWFWDDFGDAKDDVFKFISAYVDKGTAASIMSGEYDYEWLDYDWSLNERRTPPPAIRIIDVLPRDAIMAVFEPEFVTASDAKIAVDAEVIGVEINGDAKAYSLNLLNGHEIVNDTVGGAPVAVTW